MGKKKVKGQPEGEAVEGEAVEGQDILPGIEGVVAGEPKVRKPRVRTSKNYDGFSEITLLSDKNPKREGSKAHHKFSQYRTGMTVTEFIAAGGTFGDLKWDSERSFISITPKPQAEGVPA